MARPTGGGGPRGPGPGAVLGRYALCEEVGAGGMASVWRAVDRQLRRVVAVKVLHPHLAKRADVVARFHREARAVAALDHPHVLRVFDVGGGDGDEPPYLVTEWIAGGSLDAFARARGPLLGEIVACVGAILCDALAVAHAAGIVHRDVKPANVLVDDGGRLVLGDFGVARVREGDSLVTATGALLGTPAFMAPEQALGDPVDARTDLYSLGATLYFLATGALPYAGPPARVMADLARGGPLPPLARNPAMGGDLARAIERLMCRDPAGRFPDARAAGAALAAVARAGGLDDPAAEWAAYFEDPAGYEDRRRDGIADCCLAAAEAARRQGAAARALALADRALSLRPGDARALRLVGAIGGQRRRRLVAAAAAAVAAIGVAAFAWWPRGGRPATPGAAAAGAEPASPAAAAPGAWAGAARLVADASDGPATADDDVVGPSASRAGASVADASAERSRAGVPAARAPARGGAGTAGARAGPRSDATATRRAASPTAGGGARPADGSARPAAGGAGPRPADDRSPDAAPPSAAPPARVTFDMDAWCDVYIDGAPRGRARRDVALSVPAGVHTFECTQGPGAPAWRTTRAVAPGQVVALRGSVLPDVTVTVAVHADAAVIRGRRYRPGDALRLPAGRHRVQLVRDGRAVADAFVRVPARAACRLVDRPRLACVRP